MSTPNQPPSPALYRRIATEEAFAPIRQVYQRMLQVTLVMLLLFLPLL